MGEAAERRRGPYAKSAAKREQIIAEAYRAFATRGYHGSSLREIAAAAGVGLSTVQHHFAGKEDLLVAVLNHRDEQGEQQAGSATAFDDEIVERARENESVPGLIALFGLLSAEATRGDHPGRPYFLSRYERLRSRYAAEFEALRERGRLRAGVDPRTAAATVVALWEGIQLQWLYEPQVIEAPRVLREYLDLVIVSGAGTVDREPSAV